MAKKIKEETQNNSEKNPRDWGLIQKKGRDGKPIWYARIIRIDEKGNKKQYTQKGDNKTHARQLRDKLAEKYTNFGEQILNGERMTFKELAENYKKRKLIPAKYHNDRKVAGLRSHQTANYFLDTLLEHFGSKRIKSITPSDIEVFKQKRLDKPIKFKQKNEEGKIVELERQRAIAGVNRELALLRTILNDAVYNGWLIRSPFLNAKGLVSLADENKRERVLSFDEEKRLLITCLADLPRTYKRKGKEISVVIKSRRKHLKPLIILAVDTAMRRGELLTLRWSDVDFDNRLIAILAFNTKTAKPRNVGMTQRVYDELSELWKNSPKDLDGLIFGITDSVKKSFSSACSDAGIDDFHFHDLRHTAITRMIQAGLSPMEVMKVSGHTQMATFARYVNPNTQAVTRIADVLTAFHAQSVSKSSNEFSEFVN
jgi:integrase